MKKCVKCGEQNEDLSKECVKCKAKLEDAKRGVFSGKKGLIIGLAAGVLFCGMLALVISNSGRIFSQLKSSSRKVHQPITEEWKRYAIAKTGFSVEAPYELKPKVIKLPDFVVPMIVQMDAYGHEAESITIDAVVVLYTNNVRANLKGAEEGAIGNMKAMPTVKKLKYKSEPHSVSGKEGSLLTGTFITGMAKVEFKAVLAVEGPQLWQIICVYEKGNSYAKEAAEKIISSAEIGKRG